MSTRLAPACACALALCAAGCSGLIDRATGSFDKPEFSGDPFPILTEMSSGAIIVGLDEAGELGMRNAVLDVMSPITVIDRGTDAPVSIGATTLTLLGASTAGDVLDMPRARFEEIDVVTLHPCAFDVAECQVGTPGVPRPFDAVLGMDAFASDALRIRRDTEEIFIFPDIAGNDVHRTRSCDAVFPTAFRGGGTLVLGGTEIAFANRRIAIDTCIAPNPAAAIQDDRGVDALLVLSTAIGPTLISESTYERYRLLDASAPDVTSLPEGTVFFPSGPVDGRVTALPSLALVANMSTNPRAPCRQVYAHHLLTKGTCDEGEDCPCEDNAVFCPAPAIVEVAPTTLIPVLVIPDAQPILQALRTELRPDRPEVDGILGLDALRALELDVDLPHGRLVARCLDRATCGARISLDEESRSYVIGCLGDMPGPFPITL